jgi:hypothetical protein
VTTSGNRRESLFDIHPVTGVSIEVFYNGAFASFGRRGWFWQVRQRGYAPDGPATGPFPTSYSAYRDALIGRAATSVSVDQDWAIKHSIRRTLYRTRNEEASKNPS